MKYTLILLFALAVGLLNNGCGGASEAGPTGPSSVNTSNYEGGQASGGTSTGQQGDTSSPGGRFSITDRTGKTWDVTHAFEEYGFVPESFQYGLGPFAITPINNPQMLSPGDSGYPLDSDSFAILGTSLNGFTRAYPIRVMSRHEVANERFGEAHVAVAY